MTGKLPINIDHLLRQRPIEGERIEYKAGWNPQSVRQNGSPEPIFESDENRTWFLVRLPVHERVSLAATDQDTIHDTQQDKSLKNKEKGQDTPQDTPQDNGHIERLVAALTGEMSRAELLAALLLTDRKNLRTSYLQPALDAGLIEMTLPDKPTSRHQRYRRTADGEALAVRLKTRDAPT